MSTSQHIQDDTILIIGGTTEGRLAVKVCDEAGRLFYYSTKNASQEVESLNGKRIIGGLDEAGMPQFCREHQVALIVDAAHPFAMNVHTNVGQTAQTLGIPVIRFERRFPDPPPRLYWFDDYSDAIAYLNDQGITRLLALSGVNTIAKLRPFWEKETVFFRIMKREESLQVVQYQGFPQSNILFYEDEQDDKALFQRIQPQAILMKESGESGGFYEKAITALSLGIPVLVIRRPALPYSATATVFGKHGLRRQIELLFPDFFPLKTGFTTGSCATAATQAALTALLIGTPPEEIEITLPDGEPYGIPIDNTHKEADGSVTCSVIKYSGDDPDVTNGTEICSNVRLNFDHTEIRFLQGKGVGKITLPGLGLEIGDPAINQTPRKMMTQAVQSLLEETGKEGECGVDITISVPKGEELATKTFNPKLGIIGGISIVGTSGIVRPFSSDAFIRSIQREIQVAKALQAERLVLNSGAKSEKYLRALYPDLPLQAFVQYGNFIGESVKAAHAEGFSKVTLGVMLGKAVKLAEGILDTHSKKSVMNKAFLLSIATEAGYDESVLSQVRSVTLARELWDIIPEDDPTFFHEIKSLCLKTITPLLPDGEVTLFLISDTGDTF